MTVQSLGSLTVPSLLHILFNGGKTPVDSVLSLSVKCIFYRSLKNDGVCHKHKWVVVRLDQLTVDEHLHLISAIFVCIARNTIKHGGQTKVWLHCETLLWSW